MERHKQREHIKESEVCADKNKETKLTVSVSVHGMPCIEVENPSPELRRIIRRVVSANRIDDPAYHASKKAGAFLQGDTDDWILVEFWQKDYQPFVDFINELIKKEKHISNSRE